MEYSPEIGQKLVKNEQKKWLKNLCYVPLDRLNSSVCQCTGSVYLALYGTVSKAMFDLFPISDVKIQYGRQEPISFVTHILPPGVHSGPVESFIPEPQSLACWSCGKALLSIVPTAD